MSETNPPANKQTAHTLFVDFVGYSRLSEAGQVVVQRELAETTLSCRAVRRQAGTDRIATRRTGDGMMLAFLGSIDDALDCAVELDHSIRQRAQSLREAVGAPFRLRMGIHTGPVVRFDDQGASDLAGEGINLAQRVMDAGDDGHILLSQQSAALVVDSFPWNQWLRDLGPCRVKHEQLVHLWNLAGQHPDGLPLGNEAVPRTVFASQEQARQLLERDQVRDRESNRAWGAALFARIAVVGSLVGALLLAGFVISRKTPGAAEDLTRFTKQVGEAARAKRRPKTTDSPSEIAGIPVGAPREALHRVDAQVPDLTGLAPQAARQAVEAVGLTLRIDARQPRLDRQGVAADRVTHQDPEPGRTMVANGEVFVSLTPAAPSPRP